MASLSDFLSTNARKWSASVWDGFVKAVDARFGPLEEQLNIQRAATDAIVARGLQVIEDGLQGVIAEGEEKLSGIQADADEIAALKLELQTLIDLGLTADDIAETVAKRFTSDDELSAFATKAEAATKAELTQAITDLLGGVPPETLDTINELAAELTDNESAVAALVSQMTSKAPLNSPGLTGSPTAPTPSSGDNSTKLATTSFVAAALAALDVGQSVAILQDQKPFGTDGGTASSPGWFTRVLNTKVADADGIVGLTSNVFTPNRACLCMWSCQFLATGSTNSRLFDLTAGVVAASGAPGYSHTSYPSSVRSTGQAILTPGHAYRVEYRCSNARATDGLGKALGYDTEVYTQVVLEAI